MRARTCERKNTEDTEDTEDINYNYLFIKIFIRKKKLFERKTDGRQTEDRRKTDSKTTTKGGAFES